jgi:hypothetical protein
MDQAEMVNWAKIAEKMEEAGDTDSWFISVLAPLLIER